MRDLYFVIIGAASALNIVALTMIVIKVRERAKMRRQYGSGGYLGRGEFTAAMRQRSHDDYTAHGEFD